MLTVLVWRETWLGNSESWISREVGVRHGVRHLAGCVLLSPGNLNSRPNFILSRSKKSLRILLLMFFGINSSLEKFLRENRVELLHVHFLHNSFLLLKIAKKLNIPIVISLHGYDLYQEEKHNHIKKWIYNYFKRKSFAQVKYFVASSHYLKSKSLAYHIPQDKLFVHYLGVDRAVFHNNASMEDRKGMLFVGRLSDVKGIEKLVLMYLESESLQKHPLTVIGSGPFEHDDRFLDLVSKSNVRHLKNLTSKEVADEMRRHKVLFSPSQRVKTGQEETLGLVNLEAISCGLPVVASNVGGVSEVIHHNVNGYLFNSEDFEIAESLTLKLLTDHSDFTNKVINTSVFHEHFDANHQDFQMCQLFRSIIEETQ